MNQVSTANTSVITMSSMEIAEITGKRHADVMRDIRKMLGALGAERNFALGSYSDTNNQTRPCFDLDREHTDCLLTGYSAVLRMKVIKRWHELEAQTPKFDMSTELGRAAFMINEMQQQQVAIAQVEHKLDSVAKSVEELNSGNIPVGYNSYSNLSAIYRLSNEKCRKLTKELSLDHKKIPFVAPNGLVTHMTVVDENSFKKAVARIKKEAVPVGRSMFNHKLLGNFKWI